jgi:hypothetical protein
MGRAGARNAARFAQDAAQWLALAGGLRAAFPDLPLLLRPDLLHSRQVAFFWGIEGGLWRQGPGLWSGPLRPMLPLAA